MLEVCTCPHGPFATNAYFDVTSELLLDINDVGHGDSPLSCRSNYCFRLYSRSSFWICDGTIESVIGHRKHLGKCSIIYFDVNMCCFPGPLS